VQDDSPRRGFQSPDFPSLCPECNGKRLGTEFDPALITLASECAAWVRAASDLGLRFQSGIVADIRVGRVIRSVVGHLLAAEERTARFKPPARGTMQEAMRRCFLDTSVAWPTDLHVYCWPYNSSDVVIVRGFGISRVLGRTHGPIVGDVLKFFPLAFWVTQESAAVTGYPLVDLAAFVDTSLDAVKRIELPLQRIPSALWPERPRDQEVILMHRERSYVAKRTRRERAV